MDRNRPEISTQHPADLREAGSPERDIAQHLLLDASRTFYRMPTAEDPRSKVVLESLQLSDADAQRLALDGLHGQE